MLLPEQVVPFLQHDDPIVRQHVRRYFHDSHDFGPLTADHYWDVIERLGENDWTLGLAADLNMLPQTDGSLHRLIKALASKPSEKFDFHYQHAARDMEMAVFQRNRHDLLACPQLLTHVRQHLELRLNLLDQPPADAWERLMAHGRELADQYSGSFNQSQSDALIEAAARGGTEICQMAMTILDDESAADDWREIFAVRVLGLARYEPAIDPLVEKLAIDADVLREEVNRALSRLASPRVIERLVGFYPGKPWHVRLYAHSSLPTIKRPQSADALLKFLEVERALEEHPDPNDPENEPLTDTLLIGLGELGSLAGLDESRRVIAQFPDDADVTDLCECLLATAIMTGVTLPDEPAWRKRIAAYHNRMANSRLSLDSMLARMRRDWIKSGMSSPTADKTPDEPERDSPPQFISSRDHYPDPVQPIRNTARKIGRNDPCPCASGKKFKKCCGK
jgi:hypothetical protein